MYDKWNLERYPFYLRPIDKSSISDFSGRTSLIKDISLISRSREGVIAIIGERGVGTTSLSNYSRFTQKKAYTFKYEIRVEEFDGAAEVFEAIVYSLAHDMVQRKIAGKTARAIINEYNSNQNNVQFSAKLGGVGFTVSRKSKTKNIFPVLNDMFVNLVNEVTSGKTYEYCIFQMNNFDATTMDEKKIIDLLNIFRDLFHTPKTIWYLLGDSSFEDLVRIKVNRVSSIIRHWITANPIPPNEFSGIFKRRIENSGAHAVNPFTKKAILYLAECTMGRPRVALDIAGRLLDKFADNPFVDEITTEIVEQYAQDEIDQIAQIDRISPATVKILRIIRKYPGKNSSEISKLADIPPGNLKKYINPLIKRNFVRSIKNGRTTLHYPQGLGLLIKG